LSIASISISKSDLKSLSCITAFVLNYKEFLYSCLAGQFRVAKDFFDVLPNILDANVI